VKGVGKKAEPGVSEFKSWNAFEEEASYLWKNAYFYNEDGSEIFIRAQNLEVRIGPILALLILTSSEIFSEVPCKGKTGSAWSQDQTQAI